MRNVVQREREKERQRERDINRETEAETRRQRRNSPVIPRIFCVFYSTHLSLRLLRKDLAM